MKKVFVLLLVAVMCLSLVACGGDEVSEIEVDGKKVSVTDFLIEHLSEYMSTEEFANREKRFVEFFEGAPAVPFTVTRVVELVEEDMGSNHMSVHYLLVKADWGWAIEDNGYTNILLIVNYDTGEVLDEFMVDESALNNPESVEYMNYILLHGALVGDGYDGGIILTETEKRTELSEKDISAINEALHK